MPPSPHKPNIYLYDLIVALDLAACFACRPLEPKLLDVQMEVELRRKTHQRLLAATYQPLAGIRQ